MCARVTIGYDAVENFSRNLKPGSSFATSGGFCALNAESPNILKYSLEKMYIMTFTMGDNNTLPVYISLFVFLLKKSLLKNHCTTMCETKFIFMKTAL